MTPSTVLGLVQHSVSTALLIAAPMLATALAVGILVGLIQAITQVQEQTLTFVPKLGAVALALVATLPWVLQTLVAFFTEMMRAMPDLVG
jgi:flagellar biosynthesis protein FliQ